MTWYTDASFIVSAFGEDSKTPAARGWLKSCTEFPIVASRLSLLEARTAFKAAVAGGRLTAEKMSQALEKLERARRSGHLKVSEIPPKYLFPQAQRICDHSPSAPVCRALDLLHVAAAVILDMHGLLSFDQTQRTLAEFEGLRVNP